MFNGEFLKIIENSFQFAAFFSHFGEKNIIRLFDDFLLWKIFHNKSQLVFTRHFLIYKSWTYLEFSSKYFLDFCCFGRFFNCFTDKILWRKKKRRIFFFSFGKKRKIFDGEIMSHLRRISTRKKMLLHRRKDFEMLKMSMSRMIVLSLRRDSMSEGNSIENENLIAFHFVIICHVD